MNWIYEYGLFLAKTTTIILALVVVLILIANQRRQTRHGELELTDLGERYRELQRQMQQSKHDDTEQKSWLKQQKKEKKAENKLKKQQHKIGDIVTKSCTYVIDFKGSMDAHEVISLREEITAILTIIKPEDDVLLRLESPGGVVHGYGLAASQLQRLRQQNVRLTVVVDKVAASGGYMMACVADKIVSAPFAIIGSIGVVAQLPNFHRLLQKNDIDVELHTAGEYKRTLTLFGENTREGREKFKQELNQTHQLFKDFVRQQRPSLDIDQVATGEHWFGSQAKELGLVDEISTSDDLILAAIKQKDVIKVSFSRRKRLLDKVISGTTSRIERVLLGWWQRGQRPNL